jgi:hypothetical protein
MQGRFDLDTFSEATVKVAQSLVPASVELWKKVQAKMLPTPAKFHYQFNMRDLSKVSILTSLQDWLCIHQPSLFQVEIYPSSGDDLHNTGGARHRFCTAFRHGLLRQT